MTAWDSITTALTAVATATVRPALPTVATTAALRPAPARRSARNRWAKTKPPAVAKPQATARATTTAVEEIVVRRSMAQSAATVSEAATDDARNTSPVAAMLRRNSSTRAMEARKAIASGVTDDSEARRASLTSIAEPPTLTSMTVSS